MKTRAICWFSCGVASAVATKLALEQTSIADELKVVYIYLKNEHPDGMRFLKDCEKWLNCEVEIIQDTKYNADVDEVIRKARYMSGVYGAMCTSVLKKQVRYDYQKDNDIHIFGMTKGEEHRVDRLIDGEPNIQLYNPLIDKGLTKVDCFKIINEVGIEVPTMYKLGYHNNNCIGCVKAGGAGYWNKIRKDFPEVFFRRSEQEKLLGVALTKMSEAKYKRLYPEHHGRMLADHKAHKVAWKVSGKSLRIPLRYLPPDAGNVKELNIGSCGFFCERS